MAQPLAVPFSPHSMLPAASMTHPLTMVPEGDITMQHESDPLKGSLRIDECDDEEDPDSKPRAAKRSRMSFQCDDCGTCYTEKRALARHRHTDQHRKKLGLPPNKKHSCTVCGKLFGRGHDLKRHYNEQHPNHAADRTTPGSNHSGEPGFSGSEYGGSDHAFSTDGAAGSSVSPMTAATALSQTPEERCSSSSSLPDEKPFMRYFNSPDGFLSQPKVVRHVRTMSDLNNHIPIIRMDQIDEMDIMDDGPAPTGYDQPRLRPSASVGSLAQRSDASSMRHSQYSTDHSINTPASDSVPDVHPYMTKPSPLKDTAFSANVTLKANDDTVQPMLCTMCSETFEDDPDELLVHLRRHLEDFQGEYRCQECDIGFVHEEDLKQHTQAAIKGHCGFGFHHAVPCTGHHPPSQLPWIDSLPDSDNFRLCNKLRHWEQAQLSAYVSEVNSMIASRRDGTFQRWSVGEIMRGSRNSFRVSVNTYASAPCDVDEDGKTDIGGLQQRFRHMSLKKAGTSLKSIIRKQRLPPSIPEQPPSVMNKQLQTAISRGYLSRAEKLLREGAQRRAVQTADPTLTSEALWGHGYLFSRNAEHRVSEEVAGTCAKCHITKSSFENGLNKIRMLVAHGADPNQPGGLCGHPLITAAWMGKADVVKYLLHKGARIEENVGTIYGTALCTAAAQSDSSGALKVVNVLLAERADVHYQGPEGTALELARRKMEALSMEALGMSSALEDHPVRTIWCQRVIEVLENAERCTTPPMTGTLYCADNSLTRHDSPGVATFKSFRSPAVAAG